MERDTRWPGVTGCCTQGNVSSAPCPGLDKVGHGQWFGMCSQRQIPALRGGQLCVGGEVREAAGSRCRSPGRRRMFLVADAICRAKSSLCYSSTQYSKRIQVIRRLIDRGFCPPVLSSPPTRAEEVDEATCELWGRSPPHPPARAGRDGVDIWPRLEIGAPRRHV